MSEPNKSDPSRLDSIADEVNRYLASSAGLRVLEGKMIDYAVERKTAEAVKQYLALRVLAPCALLAAIAAYFGLDFRDTIKSLKADAQKTLGETTVLLDAAKANSSRVDDEIKRSEGARTQLNEKLRQLSTSANKQFLEVTKEITQQAIASTAQASVAAEVAKTTQLAVVAERERLLALEKRLEAAYGAAATLEKKLQFQAKLINTALIVSVSLFDKSRSRAIDLPQLDGRVDRLVFNVRQITESTTKDRPRVELDVLLNDKNRPISFVASDGADWNAWQPIGDEPANYEYRVDFVLRAPGIRDYLSIQVRARKAFVEALQSPATR